MDNSLSFSTVYGTEYLRVKPRDVDVGDAGQGVAHLTEDAPDQILQLLDGERIARAWASALVRSASNFMPSI